MDSEDMKNMIVLKNLPSNIIEEAIVILKPNVKLKSMGVTKNNKKTNKTNLQNPKKYIINEAEMIVGNYISNIENNKNKNMKTNKKMEMKCKRLKVISLFLGIMFLASILIR